MKDRFPDTEPRQFKQDRINGKARELALLVIGERGAKLEQIIADWLAAATAERTPLKRGDEVWIRGKVMNALNDEIVVAPCAHRNGGGSVAVKREDVLLAPAQPEPRGSEALREALLRLVHVISGDWHCWCGKCLPPIPEYPNPNGLRASEACAIADAALAAATAERTPQEIISQAKHIRFMLYGAIDEDKVRDVVRAMDAFIKFLESAYRQPALAKLHAPTSMSTNPNDAFDASINERPPKPSRGALATLERVKRAAFERGWQSAIEAAAQRIERDAMASLKDWPDELPHGAIKREAENRIKMWADTIRSLRPSPAPKEK